jgi:DNA-binding LacI/PurR family transcriptional regulator
VVPLTSRWFFAQILAAAEAVLRRGGYDVLLHSLVDAHAKERFFAELPVRRKVDGLLVVSFAMAPPEVAALEALRVPVVFVGSACPAFSAVRIDEVGATRQAAEHLDALGHTSVAMLSALEDADLAFSSAHERRAGFRRALPKSTSFEHLVAGTFGVEGGVRAFEAFWKDANELPSAVFAEYDEMAMGFLCAAQRVGVDVPRDVSVLGFDDHEFAGAFRLSTVAQPVREQGDLGGRLLLDHMAERLTEPVDVVLETRLVARGTTGPALRSADVQGSRVEQA